MMRFEDILKEATQKRATDVYLITGSVPCLNIDGTFVAPEACPDKLLSPQAVSAFAQSIMTPEQWYELEQSRELNIAYMDPKVGRFRVNALWQRGSLGLVMRRVEMNIPTLKDLGLPPVLRKVSLGHSGIVLVCGATGCGKSTSMASMLDYRNHNRTGHIVTIEDPIEFIYKHNRSIVTQREVGMDTDSFEEALKNSLRQAPSVISIGELRTQDSVQFAMHAAETGHLVFATLHSTNAVLAVERIMNFYPPSMERAILVQMSLNIRSIICQRLIPGKGTSRRVAAVEIMVNNPRAQDLISKGKLGELRSYIQGAHQDGTCDFDKALYQLAMQGKITEGDAVSFAESPNEMEMKFKGMGVDSSSWGEQEDPWTDIKDPYELPDASYKPTTDKYSNLNNKGMIGENDFVVPEAGIVEHGIGGERGRISYGGSRAISKLNIEAPEPKAPAWPPQKNNKPDTSKISAHKISVQQSMNKSEKLENKAGRLQENMEENQKIQPQQPEDVTDTIPVSELNAQQLSNRLSQKNNQQEQGSSKITEKYKRMINEGLPDSVAEDIMDSEFDDLDDDLD